MFVKVWLELCMRVYRYMYRLRVHVTCIAKFVLLVIPSDSMITYRVAQNSFDNKGNVFQLLPHSVHKYTYIYIYHTYHFPVGQLEYLDHCNGSAA